MQATADRKFKKHVKTVEVLHPLFFDTIVEGVPEEWTCYVRVRAFWEPVEGERFLGPWSEPKSAK